MAFSSPAILDEVRYTNSSYISLATPFDQAAPFDQDLLYYLGQIAVNPKQYSSGWLGHFSIAQEPSHWKIMC